MREENKSLLVVNLFGAPCTGKSAMAAAVYAKLKFMGINVELVREYAKELVWEKRTRALGLQEVILAEQNRRLQSLVGQVDLVITDCPLLLGIVYATSDYPASFAELCFELFDSYTNLNYLMLRDYPYVEQGRVHTEQEAQAIHIKIAETLLLRRQAYKAWFSMPEKADMIVSQVIHHLGAEEEKKSED